MGSATRPLALNRRRKRVFGSGMLPSAKRAQKTAFWSQRARPLRNGLRKRDFGDRIRPRRRNGLRKQSFGSVRRCVTTRRVLTPLTRVFSAFFLFVLGFFCAFLLPVFLILVIFSNLSSLGRFEAVLGRCGPASVESGEGGETNTAPRAPPPNPPLLPFFGEKHWETVKNLLPPP